MSVDLQKEEKPSYKTNPIFNHLPVNVLRGFQRYSNSIESGIKLMTEIQEIDPDFYRDLHKGTPYYWIACSAFQSHDYDTAIYFFNAAAEEDIRDGAKIEMNEDNSIVGTSPALSFMMLDIKNSNQAAIKLTEESHNSFIDCIAEYKKHSGHEPKLALETVQRYFILEAIKQQNEGPCKDPKNWQPLVTSMIAYLLEWKFRQSYLELYPRNQNYFPFFMHLFKGCALFESLLKENPQTCVTQQSLSGIILNNDNLKNRLGISRKIKFSARNFESVLGMIREDLNVQDVIEITSKIRNTTGHNLAWKTKMTQDQYNQLAEIIFFACLHVIAKLYVPEEDAAE